MKLISNIKKFYAFSFFSDLLFIMPVIVLFWQQNGLSLTQIMFLQSIFAIAIVLFEVPTGVIADKYGRKHSISIGTIILIVGVGIYSLGFSFWQFALAEIVWALGLTFVSGTDSALVYETLKQSKKEKDFKKVWGNTKSFNYLATGTAAIIGGFVATYSLRANWYLEILTLTFALLLVLSFKEPKHYKIVEEKNYWKHTKESFKEAFTKKPLLFLVLFHALLATISRIGLWFYQPYMESSGLPLASFGIIWAAFTIFAISGSKLSHRLESKLSARWSLWFIILMMTLSMIFMSYWFALFGILFIFSQQFIRGFSPPVLQDYTNKILTPERRATLLSIQSLAGSLTFAVIGPIFGFIGDTYSLSTALLVSGISFLIAFSILMLWGRRINKKS